MKRRYVNSLTWPAFVAAVLTLAGSLWLSIGMQLKACPLCFYQRTFVMGIAGVMGIGLLSRVKPISLLSLLSLPMGAGALCVAVFHVWLEAGGKLECPAGILGIGTAPQQALAAQAVVLVLLLGDCLVNRESIPAPRSASAAAVILGAALAYAGIKSSPPLPSAPAVAYEKPADVCRPPYDANAESRPGG
jgi:disulfide bond formation protein DsbB